MRKLFVFLFFLFLSVNPVKSQSISCQELYETIIEEGSNTSSVTCYNSTMLVKAEYYTYDGMGFVIAFIKNNKYDFSGKPYIFCGISYQRWISFKSSGIVDGWGEAFHEYIRDYTCDCY
jgi:hypothetical protein